jgi:hypothetical protein
MDVTVLRLVIAAFDAILQLFSAGFVFCGDASKR